MMINDRSTEFDRVFGSKGKVTGRDGSVTYGEDLLVCEHFMSLEVNGELAAELSCLADHLKELVFGRLLTEGIIEEPEDVERLFICKKGERAEVVLRPGLSLKPFEKKETIQSAELTESEHTKVRSEAHDSFGIATGRERSCCTGNRQYLAGNRRPERLPEVDVDRNAIFELAEFFKRDGGLHARTFGTHSAYLRTPEGEILGYEDISRHNAIDKAVGTMLLSGADPAGCILFTTGRIPADMVERVIMSGIPVLVSKSVPTDRALALSSEYGLRLICKAWPDSYVEYDS